MSTIQCNIVSPEGELFSGPVELLSAEGAQEKLPLPQDTHPVNQFETRTS